MTANGPSDHVSETFSAWQDPSNTQSDPEEQRVLFATFDSYRQYGRNAHYTITHRRRQNLYALPQPQFQLLTSPPFSLLDTLSTIDDCIDINADLSDTILELGLQSFSLPSSFPDTTAPPSWHNTASLSDITKAHSTLRQFCRDWSAEGYASEVKPLLGLIHQAMIRYDLPPSPSTQILLPGAGLGRLLFDLTLLGYSVEGNEISYHQILASNFILNHTPGPDSYTIYPFVSTFTNNTVRSNQLRAYSIPDIHPATALAEARARGRKIGEMNMTAGDFITSYSDPDSAGRFNVVVTCYFIDTAPNLIRYIETTRHCLRDGGLWVNVGPLLWHFDNQQVKDRNDESNTESVDTMDVELGGTEPKSMLVDGLSNPVASPRLLQAIPPHGDVRLPRRREQEWTVKDKGIGEAGSFELSDEEVRMLVEKLGFTIEEHSVLGEELGGYIQDRESMMQSRYRCSFWVARKVQGEERR